MKYRIVKKQDGRYYAQVKKSFFHYWEDIFRAGIAGIMTASSYEEWQGSPHNNRGNETLEEAEEIIKDVKSHLEHEQGKDIIEVIKKSV